MTIPRPSTGQILTAAMVDEVCDALAARFPGTFTALNNPTFFGPSQFWPSGKTTGLTFTATPSPSGSTSRSYKLIGTPANGIGDQVLATVTSATGPSSLSGSSTMTLQWNWTGQNPAGGGGIGLGFTAFKVYRSTGGTTGIIGTVTPTEQGADGNYSVVDTGAAPTTYTLPTTNFSTVQPFRFIGVVSGNPAFTVTNALVGDCVFDVVNACIWVSPVSGVWKPIGTGTLRARLSRHASGSVTTTLAQFAFDNVDLDPDQDCVLPVYTPYIPGTYHVSWQIKIQPVASSQRLLSACYVGSTAHSYGSDIPTNSNYAATTGACDVDIATAGTSSNISIYAQCTALAAALQLDGPGQSNYMNVHLVAAHA